MKVKLALFLCMMLAVSSTAIAWESHWATPKYDENGDMRFNSEHVVLTSEALTESDAFGFLDDASGAPLEICGTVKDFNSKSLNWTTLKEREFCPANFSELPDFFLSMEDYINQANACPALAEWDVEKCHSFEHFMGALNSSHFPPQLKENYQRYHDIAQAVTKHSNNLHDKLFLAGAESTYKEYWQECKMEALTYESIGQHYLQDQWSMGHMWYRWGGPDVDDFPLTGVFSVLNGLPLAKITYGTIIGGVSGMIHGWKSTVDPLIDPLWLSPDIALDALCYYSPGVEWVRADLSGRYPGMGDLFLTQEGDFTQQKYEQAECTEEGFRQLRSFQVNPSEINDLCWENLATNEAMNIGLNYSPSSYASLGVLGVGATLIGIDGIGREMTDLALTFDWAAFWHPYDTYIAEGYTSQSRTRRLNLFSIKPNDEYVEVSSYIDPARTAPGDPADSTGVQPDNDLFGVRQVRYFNKCHAELYCDDASIVNDYRDGCQSDSNSYQQLDCQICEELAGRFFLGDPTLCEILAPGINPDPTNQNLPDTSLEVSDWCHGEQDFPRTYVATGTRILSVEGDFPGESIVTEQRIDVIITLKENGDVTGEMSTPDGPTTEAPVIGGEPGETRTIIENRIRAEVACPADASNNAGETVSVVQFSFANGPGWAGEWSEDGTYNMKFQTVYFDMTITGNFSNSTISGGLDWPDTQETGYESDNFICSRNETTIHSRIAWDFSGQIEVDE